MMKKSVFFLIGFLIGTQATMSMGRSKRDVFGESTLPQGDWENHDIGNVTYTVTRFGSAGFTQRNFPRQGSGFQYPVGMTNWLSYGSFALGNSSSYVVDRHFNIADNDTDFQTLPGDSLLFGQTLFSDQDGRIHYDDGGHISPKGITVTQHSWAWSIPGHEDYVILHYTVENRGTNPVDSLYVGQFIDFDLDEVSYTDNTGGTDSGRRLVYINDNSSPNYYAGIKLLDPQSSANLSVIDHDLYVDPPTEMSEATKFGFLSGALSFPVSDRQYDWSLVNSAGPFDLEPGGCVTVAFAILAGDNLADLQGNADSAQVMYDLVDNKTVTACEFPTDIGFFQIYYSNGSSPYDLGFLLPGTPPWDFSAGPTDVVDTVTVRSKGGVPHADSFPLAKFVLEGWLSGAGVSAYAFFTKTSDFALWHGGSDGIVFPPFRFNDPIRFLEFPLIQGAQWSDAATFSLGGIPMLMEEVAEVVSEGEVTLPSYSNLPTLVLRTRTIFYSIFDSDTVWTYSWIVEDIGVAASASKFGGSPQFSLADAFSRLWSEGVGVEEENANPPTADSNVKLKLLQNQPNPFQHSTLIRYIIPVDSRQQTVDRKVSLKIYNITGRLVETLVDERQDPGVYQVEWEGKNRKSGIYFYRLTLGDHSLTEKIVFLK